MPVSPSMQRADGGRTNDAGRHVRVHGLDVTTEHEKGSTSRGVTIPFYYGRLQNAAGEHVDVCLGPHLKSPKIFVIDQESMRPAAAIGFGSVDQVRAYYLKAFADNSGRKKLRSITEMTVEQSRKWLTKPAAKAA
jgi:Inorganic Pyrophosphatase